MRIETIFGNMEIIVIDFYFNDVINIDLSICATHVAKGKKK